MINIKKIGIILGIIALFFSVKTSFASKPDTKINICHKEGDSGRYHLINVSINAKTAHLNHGDGLSGDLVPEVNGKKFTEDCSLKDTGFVVYNSIPDVLPGNIPSEGFEANSDSEFGGQIMLTGTARTNPIITVVMSSWGCQNGHWTNGTCTTTPGATFTHPITINVYNVNSGNTVGSLITTQTRSFTIPYRPSTDPVNCPAGGWYDGSTCFSGLAYPISFNLSGTLPDNVIVSVAYNTTHYGYSPIGESALCFGSSGGCGYDSLNVGAKSNSSVIYPIPGSVYLYSMWSGAYGDGGLTGVFRLTNGWTGYQPVIKVVAN